MLRVATHSWDTQNTLFKSYIRRVTFHSHKPTRQIRELDVSFIARYYIRTWHLLKNIIVRAWIETINKVYTNVYHYVNLCTFNLGITIKNIMLRWFIIFFSCTFAVAVFNHKSIQSPIGGYFIQTTKANIGECVRNNILKVLIDTTWAKVVLVW